MLDSTPLGRLARVRPDPSDVLRLNRLIASNTAILIPEVSDFEIRRSLLLHGLVASISELNFLQKQFVYVPITTSVMLTAADLWAQSRKRGRPTADVKELDCDVILAAQAIESGAEILTENVGHLEQFVRVHQWSSLPT